MIKLKLVCIFLLINFHISAQVESYGYKRALSGVKDQWHTIELPPDMFGKLQSGLADIRIYGISNKKDTVEAPYILVPSEGKYQKQNYAFKIINQSKTDSGFYYTLESNTNASINDIRLQFLQDNFDWRVTLDGSQDLLQWFTILHDYRIVSIKNDQTDFQFTNLAFPSSRYKYLRLQIKSAQQPDLRTAVLSLNDTTPARYQNYTAIQTNIQQKRDTRQTLVHIDLGISVPVARVQLYTRNSFDFYRPLVVQYLRDSIHTEEGWIYNYETIHRATFNSLEVPVFNFGNSIVKQLRIVIENFDNTPVNIDSVIVSGYVHELVARFTTPGDYFLVYGNKQARYPEYDIISFMDRIPKNLSLLKLGKEEVLKEGELKRRPLFENKLWLWVVIGVLIILLGYFTLKMLNKKPNHIDT